MKWTKLDNYDCELFPGVIRVYVSGSNDPDLVDIMSEIHRSGGRIYVDGNRYLYSEHYKINSAPNEPSYIEIHVEELATPKLKGDY